MALLKCHECGNEVSSQAKACPKCGAKKSNSVSVGVLAAVIGIALLYNFANNVTRKESSAAIESSTTQSDSQTPPAAWQYFTVTDDMTSKTIAFAESKSLNKENLHWPYGRNIGATLTLRKHPRHGKSVYVTLDKGQILCRSYESCTVSIRFDDRPPHQYSAIGPSDGSTEVVFIQNHTRFVTALKQSKKVLIELPMYQDGNRSWQFNVDDLSWQ